MSVVFQRPGSINVGVLNPGEIVYIKGSENVDGSVRMRADTSGTFAAVEQRSAGVWELQSIRAANLSSLSDNAVPYHSGNQILEDSGANLDPSTLEWTFDHSINVPAGSVNVGTTLRLSEGGQDLVIADLITEVMSFGVNAPYTSAGSTPPQFTNYGAEFNFPVQTDDTTVITTNPLTFQNTTVVTPPNDFGLTSVAVFRANGPMTNFRVKVTDNATGMVLRYFPSQAAFEGRAPGFDLIAGDNTFYLTQTGTDGPGEFYLGYVPVVLTDGQVVDFELVADNMDLLGDATEFPYFDTQASVGVDTTLLFEGEETEVIAFASMYEDNSSGSSINNAQNYKGWKTATAGPNDGTNVGFQNNSTADRLVLLTDDANGFYFVTFSLSMTNDGGKMITGAIHLNNTEQASIKARQQGDSGKQDEFGSSGILELENGDFIDVRVKSEDNDDLDVYLANVSMHRIG